MKRALAIRLAALVAAAASLALVASAAASPAEQLRPLGLRVYGGAEAWHADNDFRLDWDRPPVASQGFPISAVDYRIREGAAVLSTVQFPWDTAQIEGIRVPAHPGIYSADVWLEGPAGEPGPIESTTLRFDNARPGPAQPHAAAAWVPGNAAATVTIDHPSGPLPISGIRGYAVSVDRGAESTLCQGPDRCSLAETDLRGGVSGDTASLGVLPEGVNVVRAVAVSNSGMRSSEVRSAVVRVDATRAAVALQGASPGWVNGPVRLMASAVDALSGMTPSGPNGAYTAIAVDGALPRLDYGDSTTATVSGEGIHSVAFYARDAAGNVDEDSPPRAAIRIDETPPRVAFANSQDRSEPERIEATVTDILAGFDPTRGSIAVRPLGSRQPFQGLATVAVGERLVTHWESDAFAAGTYEFRATAYDAAGNSASSERRGDGARLVLANPLKIAMEITAGFGGKQLTWQRCSRDSGRRRCRREQIRSFEARPTTRAVPYGHGVSYSGQLSSNAKATLAGLPVQVIETFAAGAARPQRTTTVQTAADGTFLAHLAPGPSRDVEVVFAGNRTLTRATGGGVRLQVLSGVRMRASSSTARVGGAPVIFSGRIGNQDASIPASGRPVELQFRLPGSKWAEFRTVETDARGRFRYPYSFSDDDSRGIRFQFRAFAPAQDGWPYEPAASQAVFVTGR